MKSKLSGRLIAPLATVALLLLAAGQGCVSRSMTIKSEPEGASVYLDDKYIGETPVTIKFKDYGTRGVRLEKKGLQTLRKRIRVTPPWYQRFPLDFLSEVVIPHRFEDEREFSFSLTAHEQERKGFLRRANEKRKRVLSTP